MEQGKISSAQMASILYPSIISNGILSMSALAAAFAGNDMWLTVILASTIGYLLVFVYWKLHKLFPEQTIVEYSQSIIGTLAGRIFSLVLLFQYVHTSGRIVRGYADFIVGAFLPETPVSLVMGSMVFVCALSVRAGIEVIGRSAQLLVPMFVLPVLIMTVLLIQDLDPTNLLPVLGHGIIPALKGTIVTQTWLNQFFLISFLLPFLSDKQKGLKWGMITNLLIMATLLLVHLIVLFLFGGEAVSNYIYPLMEATKYISIANFFEHLEAAVMAVWVLGTYVQGSMNYYATVLGTAQWFRLADYRPIVFPIGILIVSFGFWDLPNEAAFFHFLKTTSPFYLFTMAFIFPAVLLVIAGIRGKKVRNKGITATKNNS